MRLYVIAGLPPTVDPSPEIRAVLTAHAGFFLEAGGAVTLSDWQDLDLAERAALAAAGRAMAVAQATRIGMAGQGDLAALRVQAELDGGRAHDDALLAVAVRQASREVRRG